MASSAGRRLGTTIDAFAVEEQPPSFCGVVLTILAAVCLFTFPFFFFCLTTRTESQASSAT